MRKRAFIKDPLWGNVEFFSWESCVTNHFVFNRLTNIIQNSSAFRAYPGLKYSRFLHTIGVVHVVTQLLPNSLKNANSSLHAEFFKEARKADSSFNKAQVELIRKELAGHLGGNIEFAVLLAALRMSAFIHDLGHLPYSHVFESALESFISKGIEGVIEIKPDTAKLRAKLIHLLEIESSYETDAEPDKIHERVGMKLATALQHELRMREDPLSQLSANLIHIACDLLRTSTFPIAKTFIKGTVDADRIDFIRRDGVFSGLFSSAVDYGRLFTLYTLEETVTEAVDPKRSKKKKGKNKIVACPSNRAVSETEKLLWERFQDYKYIVMHHKVHLYDEIVENILVRLLAEGTLDTFINDLVHLLETKHEHKDDLESKNQEVSLLLALLLEFDDPWLESHIRSTYRKNISSLTIAPSDNEGKVLFQVYVEQRQRFISAFKSDCEFWDAVSIYAKRLSKLRPLKLPSEEGETIRNERYYFFNALYGTKFSLQSHLKSKLGYSVIVGPTERKVNYGIRNDNEAAFYQINELLDFLKLKKYRTMLFNLWFESKDGVTKEKFLAEALPIIERVVFHALDELRGERDLPSI